MTEKYSYWLPVEQIQDDHSDEVWRFVDCYMVFYGTAGKCFNCYAQEYCKNLNKDAESKEGQIKDSIKEVKKILLDNWETSSIDEVVHQIDDYLDDYYAQLFPQPLDDEGLREKIAREIGQHTENCAWEDCSQSEQDAAYRSADFIIFALLPDMGEELRIGNKLTATLTDKCRELELQVEEAENRGIDSGIKAYESTCESLIQEARKQGYKEEKEE